MLWGLNGSGPRSKEIKVRECQGARVPVCAVVGTTIININIAIDDVVHCRICLYSSNPSSLTKNDSDDYRNYDDVD